ncbi:MAG: YbaB/EbfC family nucleoid-associated protein [Fimbriimonadia bacterium]|jgi:hypothetical protein
MKLPKMPGGNMMKQLQDAMERMQALEQELQDARLEVSAGGGMVQATFSGTGEMVAIKINRDVVDPDDVEMLEDLVLSAVREGALKASQLREERTAEIQSMLPQVPGMQMPF